MPNKIWFCYDPNETGFELYATAEEAEGAAKKALEMEREFAALNGEWEEDAVAFIAWGKLHGATEEIDREEGGVDYRLVTK